jgi:hypothetical protein
LTEKSDEIHELKLRVAYLEGKLKVLTTYLESRYKGAVLETLEEEESHRDGKDGVCPF